MKPDPKFLLAHPDHFFALGWGSGLSPKAPGTAGTLAGWLSFLLLDPIFSASFGLAGWLIFLLVAAIYGVFACDRTGRALGVPDHGAIVWDEIVAFWLVLVFTPPGLLWQALAFVLFRFFDILKPPPIRWADTRLKGGFGVMFDDFLAAGYALLVLALIVHFVAPHFGGLHLGGLPG